MPLNIAEFKAQASAAGGFLKNNKFVVRISIPKILQGKSINGTPIGGTEGIGNFIEYHADKVSLPGVALQASELRRQGVGNLERAPFGAAFTDCDMSFTIDQSNAHIWNFFQSWMNAIYFFDLEQGTEFEMSYKNDYSTIVTIFVYNDYAKSGTVEDKPVITIDLIDAFPMSMSDLSLDWAGTELSKLNVKFNFWSWSEPNTRVS